MIPILLATVAVIFLFATIVFVHEAVERLSNTLKNIRKEINDGK
jgi:uncharacterized protein YoxC